MLPHGAPRSTGKGGAATPVGSGLTATERKRKIISPGFRLRTPVVHRQLILPRSKAMPLYSIVVFRRHGRHLAPGAAAPAQRPRPGTP